MANYIDDYTKYEDPIEKPLFGETTPKDRVLNLIVGAFTALLVTEVGISACAYKNDDLQGRSIFLCVCIFLVLMSHLILETLVCAFVIPWPPVGINIFFSLCILLVLFSHLVLIYWYRHGDLEPRFRTLIFFNAFTIILLCICANLFIFQKG